MNIYSVQITEEDGPSYPPLTFGAVDLPSVVLAAAKDRYGKDCAVRHRWDNWYQAMWGRSDEFEGIATFKNMKFIEVNAEGIGPRTERFTATIELVTALPIPSKDD